MSIEILGIPGHVTGDDSVPDDWGTGLAGLRGIAAGALGGEASEDYVACQRGAWADADRVTVRALLARAKEALEIANELAAVHVQNLAEAYKGYPDRYASEAADQETIYHAYLEIAEALALPAEVPPQLEPPICQKCGYRVCHVDCGAEDYDTPAVEPWLALYHAANAIHGSVDEQTYDENRRAEWDLPAEHEFSVTITAGEARDLSQAMIGVAALKLAADAARASPAALPVEAVPQGKLWLWKNFVDGRPEYWAFNNPFPVHLDCGDPQTLGEPCGYALFKPSRAGRTDVSETEVLRRIKEAKP